jgi:glucose-1-phosphate thymidylyltransferase
MKGIILAGGTGSRLDPITRVVNKHLLPVYDRPMVAYPLEALADAGVTEIMVVTGREHLAPMTAILPGLEPRASLSFAPQPGPFGIADALARAEGFADGQPVVVALGDNLFGAGVDHTVERFRDAPHGARVLLAATDQPAHFGVARLSDAGDTITGIVEKPGPGEPTPAHIVTGLYCYDATVFDICRELDPSDRGELEITDVNKTYLARGDLRFDITQAWWADAGTFEDLHRAATLVATRGVNGHPPR